MNNFVWNNNYFIITLAQENLFSFKRICEHFFFFVNLFNSAALD